MYVLLIIDVPYANNLMFLQLYAYEGNAKLL